MYYIQTQRVCAHTGVSIKSLHMYALVQCIHLSCAANTLHATITVGHLQHYLLHNVRMLCQCGFMHGWRGKCLYHKGFTPTHVHTHLGTLFATHILTYKMHTL